MPEENGTEQAGPAPVRIGVFICHCGKNIGGYLEVPKVVEYARTLPNVVHAEGNLYACDQDGLQYIKKAIQDHQLNRVIVASCMSRTHAPLFQATCEEAGVNKYFFEFVNLREHCSWDHMNDKEGATEKAKDLVRMGVYRAALLEPLSDSEMAVIPAALNLANQGMEMVLAEAITATVDPSSCVGCGTCEEVCPYRAISIIERDGASVADVNPVLCKGCGTCVPSCPTESITPKGFTKDQLVSQILGSVGPRPPGSDPRIIVFLCNWCSNAGADLCGVSQFQYPPNIRIVRVLCSGRVEPIFLLKAFKAGIDGVLVLGCHIGDCHFIKDNESAQRVMEKAFQLCKAIGIDEKRMRLDWVSASEGQRFSELVTEFTEQVRRLGPLGFGCKDVLEEGEGKP